MLDLAEAGCRLCANDLGRTVRADQVRNENIPLVNDRYRVERSIGDDWSVGLVVGRAMGCDLGCEFGKFELRDIPIHFCDRDRANKGFFYSTSGLLHDTALKTGGRSANYPLRRALRR